MTLRNFCDWGNSEDDGGAVYRIVLDVGILIPSTFQTPEFSHMALTRYQGLEIMVSIRAATPSHNSTLLKGH